MKLAILGLLLGVLASNDVAAQDKTCMGLGEQEYLHGNNINRFAGCTVIDGDLRITQDSFKGNDYDRYPTINPADDLWRLEQVEMITGHLLVQGSHPDFNSLRFLRNLRAIRGASLSTVGAALQIYTTSISSLELNSLESIDEGIVVIGHNPNLCFVNDIDWRQLFSNRYDPNAQYATTKFNKDPAVCQREGNVCHPSCSEAGCWDKFDVNCITCAYYNLDGRCVESCYGDRGLYVVPGSNQCDRCHELCDSCDGPGADDCITCKYFKDGTDCVPRCGTNQYVDYNNECRYCHYQCLDGCSGDGPEDCHECRAYMDGTACVDECPSNKYLDPYGMCQFCHSECLGGCTGPNADNCFGCRHVMIGSVCAEECAEYSYADENNACQPCDAECLYGCYGEGPLRCTSCRNFRDGSRCVARCPAGTCSDENDVCGPCRELPAMPTYEELVIQVNELKDHAQQLVTYNNLPLISFTAFATSERTDYYAGDELLFDGIITNIGGAYDPKTSTFTCPRSGVYLFSLSIDNYMRGSLVPTIYKGRELIASVGQYSSASQNVIIECAAGETIHVKTSQAGTMFNTYGWRTSTFTGYMLAHKVVGTTSPLV